MNSIGWVTMMIREHQVRRFAEIGVLIGELARPVLERCDLDSYVMVERTVDDRLYKVFRESDVKGEFGITQKPAVLMRMESVEAARLIADGSLDMVYIDADHMYESITADLEAWVPKVRPGGIVSGHDYNKQGNYLVWKAVDERFGTVNLADDDIWWTLNGQGETRVEMKKGITIISDFREKKVAEYLRELPDGGTALIRFGHGWGDTQMFMPLFWNLQARFPKLTIDLYLECGQEKIFKSYPVKDSPEHDMVFSLNFPMSEGGNGTKAEKCCVEELGIEPFEAYPLLDTRPSPFVAVHFQGTALPNSVNCPEGVAQKIWAEIIAAGKVPVECHFEHVFHNPVNAKYGFVTNTVRGCRAELAGLIGLIQHSFAFIGVASGPFITALCVDPGRTMYLERAHKLSSYTRENVAKADVMNYQEGTVKAWLESLN